jgi:hypothetical protein
MGGTLAPMAEAEANRRALNCLPYYQAIQQQRNRQADAMDQAARYFLAPATTPMPRSSMSCNSYRMGNTIQTDCR